MTSDPDALLAEVAELARSFHWSLAELLDLEHRDRRRFLELSAASGQGSDAGEV